ncbi:fasciclin domain-containing protein [Sphingobacterium sp. KU25419]|nr:fasciclin domain-containing protein [Sphingobacterium sp. KU25419]
MMKKINFTLFKKSAVLMCMTALIFMGSCKDDDHQEQEVKTISAIVSSNQEFSLLKSALIHADLVDVLAGTGPFTVFAPNNAAFVAAGLDSETKIKAIPMADLKKILLYHVLGQKTVSSSLPNAANTAVKTLAESDVFITKNSNGVFVNGAAVTQADVMASNGVIHVINTVLMPATGNIVQIAQGNSNFTFLVAAVLKASQGSTNVAQVLSGTVHLRFSLLQMTPL